MIVGTAGHIDHGKTALVKALTGVDADRLAEEKARGITIDLGFAYADLGGGAVTGFVDVPGHERLIHTMLAGAGGIDLALLVVAADDGVMPQTREHLAILDLLGIDRGLVALTNWQLIGYMMVVYIAALQNVPDDLLEAAAIDGASRTQTLFRIKLPLVMPAVTICTFLTLTNTFKMFDQNLALTGGAPEQQTELLALNIYNTFYGRSGWQGVGQAKAVVFFIIVALLAFLQLRVTGQREAHGV